MHVQKKTIFSPKINQDRVANNVIDLQNDLDEDRLSFPLYGEKINLAFFYGDFNMIPDLPNGTSLHHRYHLNFADCPLCFLLNFAYNISRV